MKKEKIISLINNLFAAAILICVGFSCKPNVKDPIEIAKTTNEMRLNAEINEDSKYIIRFYSDNLYEIKISEDAETISTSIEVQNLATKLAVSHTILNNKIRDLASKKNISLPEGLTEEQTKNYQSLHEKVGYDFNVGYTQAIYERHKEAISILEKIINNSTDPEIKTWAEETLLETHEHLSIATVCYEHIKLPT